MTRSQKFRPPAFRLSVKKSALRSLGLTSREQAARHRCTVRSPRWRALCVCLVSQAVEDLWPEVVEGFFPWFTFKTESSSLKQNKNVLAISGPGRLTP